MHTKTVHFGTNDRPAPRACPELHAGDAIPHTRAARKRRVSTNAPHHPLNAAVDLYARPATTAYRGDSPSRAGSRSTPRTTSSTGRIRPRSPASPAITPASASNAAAPSCSGSIAIVVSGGQHLREREVVEADDRHVLGDPQPELARCEVDAAGQQVVVGVHPGRPVGTPEQREAGAVGVVEPQRGRLVPAPLEPGVGEHREQALAAQAEGLGVERGRQMPDPPVAEVDQVADRDSVPRSVSNRT